MDSEPRPSQAIQPENRCGHDAHMSILLKDPDYRSLHKSKLEKFESYNRLNAVRSVCSTPTLLPVAVHFQGLSNPNVSCLRTLAQSQIDVLNQDYQGKNADITKWLSARSYFPGVSNGEACIEFRLADKNHPAGYGLSNGQPAVTVNKTNGDNDPNWSGYINIFVQMNTGVLGYSPLGGSGQGDGVVIDAGAFGLGAGCGAVKPQAPYNLVRTLTHEMGHYLLLDHIWGQGCSIDDDVADTPDQDDSYYGCPTLGAKTCGSNDLFLNYMDYVNDACMFMFSQGQATRMENFVASNLGHVVTKGQSVFTSGGGGGGNTCAQISNVTVGSIQSTSAKLSWAAVSGAVQYEVRYKKSNATNWTKKQTTQTDLSLTGLSASTNYQFQYRVECPNGWTSYSQTQTFKTAAQGPGSGCTKTEAILKITLDDYGSETTWEVVDDLGRRVARGGPYKDGQSGKVKKRSLCLDDGCYTLFVDDSYGDGICCRYGKGKVKLFDKNNRLIAKSNGRFGYYTALDFCARNGTLTYSRMQEDEPQVNLRPKPQFSQGQGI